MFEEKSKMFVVCSGAIVADEMYRGLGGDHPIPARNGNWRAYATMEHTESGCRVAELTAVHEGAGDFTGWIGPVCEAGVDSGSAGIFDAGAFRDAEITTEDWSSECWKAREENQFGFTETIPGVVSWSGYGDGSYPVYVVRDEDGNATVVRIVFISKGEDCDYYKIMRGGEA